MYIFKMKMWPREDDDILPISRVYQGELEKLYTQVLDFETEIPELSHGLQREPAMTSEI